MLNHSSHGRTPAAAGRTRFAGAALAWLLAAAPMAAGSKGQLANHSDGILHLLPLPARSTPSGEARVEITVEDRFTTLRRRRMPKEIPDPHEAIALEGQVLQFRMLTDQDPPYCFAYSVWTEGENLSPKGMLYFVVEGKPGATQACFRTEYDSEVRVVLGDEFQERPDRSVLWGILPGTVTDAEVARLTEQSALDLLGFEGELMRVESRVSGDPAPGAAAARVPPPLDLTEEEETGIFLPCTPRTPPGSGGRAAGNSPRGTDWLQQPGLVFEPSAPGPEEPAVRPAQEVGGARDVQPVSVCTGCVVL